MPAPWPVPGAALTPIALGSVVWRLGGVQRVTVVVKATFGFVHDGAARLLPPRQLSRDDRGHDGLLDEAAETAPFLPLAGVLLTGHAHAPGGRPAASVAVRLAVLRERPLLDKTLHAFGYRATGSAVVQPFQKIALGWDRALGGPSSEDNPVGAARPNLVDPADARRPAGFGPIAAHWGPRRRLLGGVDPRAVRPGAVDLPEGIDFRFFQAAPADQQIAYLHGDEWIVLDGMHPSLPRVQTRLPGARAEARWAASSGPARAVDMVADTLVIDADRQSCSVIWRGSFVLAEAPERARIEAGLALPGHPIPWPEAAPVIAVPALPPAQAPVVIPAPAPPVEDEWEVPTQAVMIVDLARAALPFQHTPSVATEAPHRAPAEGVLPFRPVAAPVAEDPFPDDEEIEDRTGAVDFRAVALRPIAPFAVAAPGTRSATPAVPLPGAPWSPHVEAVAPPPIVDDGSTTGAFTAVLLPVVQLPVEPVAVKEPPPPPPPEPPPAPSPAPPEAPRPGSSLRETVIATLAKGEALAGLDLRGSDLRGIDFAGAALAGASLARANLGGCVLKDATLTDADLSGADLTGADLGGADLARANLSRATLAGASFTGASLVEANLSAARGPGASFAQAKLRGADLRQARLTDAGFEGADLRAVLAQKADLSRGRFGEADLTGANLRMARLPGADLAEAVLESADLRDADLERADLTGASRRTAKMNGANLKDVVGGDA